MQGIFRCPIRTSIMKRQHAVFFGDVGGTGGGKEEDGVGGGLSINVTEGKVEGRAASIVRDDFAFRVGVGQPEDDVVVGSIGTCVMEGQPAKGVDHHGRVGSGRDDGLDNVVGRTVATGRVQGRRFIFPQLHRRLPRIRRRVRPKPSSHSLPRLLIVLMSGLTQRMQLSQIIVIHSSTLLLLIMLLMLLNRVAHICHWHRYMLHPRYRLRKRHVITLLIHLD
mmetsp:Transcript_2510/g.4562  ORF Transcript_2510/g.4562 Transcript_2510/m.4562 type:complete len:222 (+) Transcript_2510:1900-2565(+)